MTGTLDLAAVGAIVALMGEMFLLAALMVAGSAAAFFAGKLPLSGMAAVALTLVPIAGFGLARAFC